MILRTRHSGDVNTRVLFSEPSLSRMSVGVSAGMSVTSDTVCGIPAVYAAVRLAAGEVATHPFRVWRGVAEQRSPVTTTWQARLLDGEYNPQQSRHAFWETVSESLDLRGNAYIWKSVLDGRVTSLWALHPDQVNVYRTAGGVQYDVGFADGFIDPVNAGRGFVRVGREAIMHIRGFGAGGQIVAPTPLGLHRATFGSALAKQQFENGFYERGGTSSFVVKFPEGVGVTQAEAWRENFEAKYTGPENAGRVKVVGHGAELSTITLTQTDAQYVESVQLSIDQIARVFGVPVSLLDGRQGAKPLSPEHERQRWGTYGVTPRFGRIEAAFRADPDLFGAARDYPMFDTARFLRGDLTSEDAIAHQQVQDGRLLVDEWRSRNGLPDLPDGLGKVPQVVPVGGAPNPGAPPAGQASSSESGASAKPSKQASRTLGVAENIQKLYLGVGKVITSDEARMIVNTVAETDLLEVPGPQFGAQNPGRVPAVDTVDPGDTETTDGEADE